MVKIALSVALLGPVALGDIVGNSGNTFKICKTYPDGKYCLVGERDSVVYPMHGSIETFKAEYPHFSIIRKASSSAPVTFKIGDVFIYRPTGMEYVLAAYPGSGIILINKKDGGYWASTEQKCSSSQMIPASIIRAIVGENYINSFDYIPRP